MLHYRESTLSEYVAGFSVDDDLSSWRDKRANERDIGSWMRTHDERAPQPRDHEIEERPHDWLVPRGGGDNDGLARRLAVGLLRYMGQFAQRPNHGNPGSIGTDILIELLFSITM